MIIKSSKNLIITLLFLIVLPSIQKQWLNLYLFNINNISIYSILYYLSGTISPFLICFYSLNNFTYYKFNKSEINSKKIITGKSLLFLVIINLIFLTYLITDYFYINFDLVKNLFLEVTKFQQPDIIQQISLMFFIAIFLIIKKSRLLFKKLILLNFFSSSFFIWYLQINNIKIDNQFYIYKYYSLENLNFINILNLISIEISFFIWSFLSYGSNLSDWMIRTPDKEDMKAFFKIIIFYFFIIIYYLILT